MQPKGSHRTKHAKCVHKIVDKRYFSLKSSLTIKNKFLNVTIYPHNWSVIIFLSNFHISQAQQKRQAVSDGVSAVGFVLRSLFNSSGKQTDQLAVDPAETKHVWSPPVPLTQPHSWSRVDSGYLMSLCPAHSDTSEQRDCPAHLRGPCCKVQLVAKRKSGTGRPASSIYSLAG